jgi:hypothetical protein
VWSIEITHFSAQNLKHHPGSELGALEVEFGPLPWANPTKVGLVGCEILFYPISKKVPQFEFVCKSYDRFTEARPGYGSRRRNMTRNRNRVSQNLVVCDGKG